MKEKAEMISKKAKALFSKKTPFIIAIDGPCGGGKTTLSKYLSEILKANAFHTDDFFLREIQRNEERLSIPGENIDHERFLSEVLLPLRNNEPFSFRPYSCKIGNFGKEINITPSDFAVVEGSYSFHKELFPFYDLKIFVDISPENQRERLKKRDPEKLFDFESKWIPLEEKYFSAFNIKESADLIIQGDD